MRSPTQEKMWEALWASLESDPPEPLKDWLIFDGYEPEIEEEFGTIKLDDEICFKLVEKITGITPITATFSEEMNGIEYTYDEEEDE